MFVFFFSSRRRHTRYIGDWSSDVCSSDLTHRYRLSYRPPRFGQPFFQSRNLLPKLFSPAQHYRHQQKLTSYLTDIRPELCWLTIQNYAEPGSLSIIQNDQRYDEQSPL